MKSKISLLLIILSHQVYAQKTQVSEVHESIGGGQNSAYSVYIDNVNSGRGEKEWTRFMKNHSGKRINSKEMKDQLIYSNVAIASIGSEPFTVYAKLIKDKNSIRITAAFAKPESFVSSEGDAAGDAAVKKFMYDFAVDLQKKLVSEYMDDMKDEQQKNRKKQKSLERSIETNKQNIVIFQNRIISALQTISKDSLAIENMKIEIARQDSLLNAIDIKLKSID